MAEINWGLINNGGSGNALVAGLQAGTQQKAYARKAALEQRQIEGQQEVGNALATGNYDQAGAAALRSGNPELFTAVQTASKANREKLKDQAELIGTVAFGLKKLPAEQRAAALAAAAPSLKQRGITDDVLAGANLSDEGLDGYISSALTMKDVLSQANSDRDYGLKKDEFGFRKEDAGTKNAITIRGQDRAAGDAAAGRALTMRGQDLSAQQQAANRATEIENARPMNEKRAEEVADKRRARDGAAAAFDVAIDSIKRIREHPAFSGSVGASVPLVNGRVPFLGAVPGTQAADFDAQLETLKAQTFLPQVQALKGAGALSDAEGAKLTAAVGALDSKMPEAAFKASLDRIEKDLTSARDRAKASAPSRNSGLPTRISDDAGFNALPSGTRFVGPDGKVRIKP